MTLNHSPKRVTLIRGDGVGPEVITSAQRIIEATGVKVEWEECEAGAAVFKKGLSSGVPQETIDSIIKNRVVLKGPLETPVGYGERSANVTLRKLFETYGNIRPIKEIPGVETPFQGRGIDFVIVRENVEDLYAGIEHMQTPGTAQCLKLISRKGCEKITRLAFEFAKSEGRKKIHCATKANIMKLTEGLLKRTFEDVAKEYPDIESYHIIVDNCAHQLAKKPEQFDIIVTTNMNGDILSDLGSGLIGGLGFAPSANIGNSVAIFEAVHGSAPKYAGKNQINPTAIILSSVMMLRHLGEFKAASAIEQSIYVTLAVDKVVTSNIAKDGNPASTTAYTDTIIRNLGKVYDKQPQRSYQAIALPQLSNQPDFVKVSKRSLAGVDVFIESSLNIKVLGKNLEELSKDTPLTLKSIACCGMKVYPPIEAIKPDTIDHYQCRFIARQQDDGIHDDQILDLLTRIGQQHRWMHVEKLNVFDEVPAFSKD